MEKKRKISQYREKLDKTLASPELTNQNTLKTLIKNQLLSSSHHGYEEGKEDLFDKRTAEVSNFLDQLRSASVKEHEVSGRNEAEYGDWKLKQYNEDVRIMYREGAQGNPFHTLLVEGYVDGPVDACLCVSWESSLYKNWWPQSVFPSFKITHHKCLQKVRIDEQICLIRMKVPWPLTDREAVLHYFVFEYFQDDLVVVLINTISDLESIEKSGNGFTKNGIHKAQDVVMIDLVGGFALQKVTPERSYFRTIANLDIKLDFIPPSLINFIARQLIGNGFRLYQKAVASVSKSEEDYSKVLGDPLYVKIREALYSIKTLNEAREERELRSSEYVNEYGNPEQEPIENTKDEEFVQDTQQKSCESSPENEPDRVCVMDIQQKSRDDEQVNETSPRNESVTNRKAFGEIEEEDSDESMNSEERPKGNNVIGKNRVNGERRFCVSPQVEQALGTLEKVISIVRNHRLDAQGHAMSSSSFSDEETAGNDPVKDLTSPENKGIVSNCKVSIEVPENKGVERNSVEPRNSSGIHSVKRVGSGSLTREGNHNRIAPAWPEQDRPTSTITSITGTPEVCDETEDKNDTNCLNEVGKKSGRQGKHTLCCFGFNSW